MREKRSALLAVVLFLLLCIGALLLFDAGTRRVAGMHVNRVVDETVRPSSPIDPLQEPQPG